MLGECQVYSREYVKCTLWLLFSFILRSAYRYTGLAAGVIYILVSGPYKFDRTLLFTVIKRHNAILLQPVRAPGGKTAFHSDTKYALRTNIDGPLQGN